jgi:hypothetical protein
MEYTLKEEIIDKFIQVEESIDIIQQRRKGFQTLNDCINLCLE